MRNQWLGFLFKENTKENLYRKQLLNKDNLLLQNKGLIQIGPKISNPIPRPHTYIFERPALSFVSNKVLAFTLCTTSPVSGNITIDCTGNLE